MERNVKQMLKLIEDDGDSFAKKAEMYYQKRPELISLVEDFYRGYKSLAERYDLVTSGEWSKNIPSDIQSQASGISDYSCESSSMLHCASPRKLGRRISGGNRAPGFDFFLGWGGNGYDANNKDGGDCGSSTLTDSDDEFDDASSITSYSGLYGSGGDHGMNKRIMDLEIELREVKEKFCMNDEAHVEGSSRGTRVDSVEDFLARVNVYEQKLKIVNQKLRLSEEEITKLKIELDKYRSMESPKFEVGINEDLGLKSLESQGKMDKEIVKSLKEELRITKEKLDSSEIQIASLKLEVGKSSESIHWQEKVNLAQRDIAAWKTKFHSEKREKTKIQERLGRLKTSLIDKDNEIRDLKVAASNNGEKIFLEKAKLKSEMSKLLGKQRRLEEHIREWECHAQSLEEKLKVEIEVLKKEIKEGKNNIMGLNQSLDALKLERDNLFEEVGSLKEHVISRDKEIEQLDKCLNHLNMEHVQLIGEVEELKSRTMELEEEIERQQVEIIDGAEEKREAIRQLCFSLEHYRNGYNVLRQALIGHKKFPVLAAKIYA
ncbi:hypothetical protein TanjilG_01459 [Lupinus angustifolius]|uniref:NAB domain-containing protein n=2 Tax=Lupinus angustifolius TaxID=3871 RepID=A0A4P1QVJ4_LUPAN|nr:hypothetical protein TanjilG_01459 [Lupinus angustifolius]